MNDKERFIKAIEDDIYCEIDGFYVFGTGKGCLYSYHLRWLADELDKKNEEWEKIIAEVRDNYDNAEYDYEDLI